MRGNIDNISDKMFIISFTFYRESYLLQFKIRITALGMAVAKSVDKKLTFMTSSDQI